LGGGGLKRVCATEDSSTIAIEVAQRIGLSAICENAKQKMAGQVRGSTSPEYAVPASAKLSEIEVAQTRNLDLGSVSV
jgi:hypothetical protein